MRSRLIAIGVLSLVLASCAAIPTAQEANDAVLTLREYEGWAWAVGIALICADLVLPVPQTAVIAALGIVYGTLLGGLLGSLGLIAGGLLGYGLMLTGARRYARRLVGPRSLDKMQSFFDRGGAWAIVLTRSLPYSVPEAMVFLAGLAGMPARKFTAALTIGSVPTAFAFAAIGAGWADQPILALVASYVLPILLLAIALYLTRPRARRRILRGVLTALVVLTVLVLLSFAIRVQIWPTGEPAAPSLPVVHGGPPAEMSRRVWVDTDAACSYARDADADDCFALLVLLRAPEIEVVGISVVDGNAPAAAAERIARDLVAQLAHTPALPIHGGLAARTALQAALAEGPLTIVALGPLTNIAAGLRGRPDLARNVARLVAVMGRRPGHLFHPAEGRGHGILFGHGPVFWDFNFAKDRAAASEIVAMNLPITLIPYEGARSVRLTAADLARLETAGGAAAWVARRARGWLSYWANVVGLDGFYPFDALAAAYAVEPTLLDCANVAVWVANDGKRWGGWLGPASLLVGLESSRVERPLAGGSAYYCPRMSPGMHGWLMARLIDRALADRRVR